MAVFSSADSTKALVRFDKYKAHIGGPFPKAGFVLAGQPTPHLMGLDIQLGQDAPTCEADMPNSDRYSANSR
jgi:hypothetical protein